MSRLLAERILLAGDTIHRFENAAARRFAEAELLRKDATRRLGAIYLYGYCVEIWLKAACYRAMQFAPRQKITKNDRKSVEALVRAHSPPGIPVGHYLPGWAAFFVSRKMGLGQGLSIEITNRASSIYIRWRETFRYAPNRPSTGEINVVYDTAAWFRKRYPRTLR